MVILEHFDRNLNRQSRSNQNIWSKSS